MTTLTQTEIYDAVKALEGLPGDSGIRVSRMNPEWLCHYCDQWRSSKNLRCVGCGAPITLERFSGIFGAFAAANLLPPSPWRVPGQPLSMPTGWRLA